MKRNRSNDDGETPVTKAVKHDDDASIHSVHSANLSILDDHISAQSDVVAASSLASMPHLTTTMLTSAPITSNADTSSFVQQPLTVSSSSSVASSSTTTVALTPQSTSNSVSSLSTSTSSVFANHTQLHQGFGNALPIPQAQPPVYHSDTVQMLLTEINQFKLNVVNREHIALLPGLTYMQKVLSSANNPRIFVIGDLHGDLHCFNRIIERLQSFHVLDNNRFVDANTYVVFLGDYTDRGAHGIEVLTQVLRLKNNQNGQNSNWNNVFLLRGNHDTDIPVPYNQQEAQDDFFTQHYTFWREFNGDNDAIGQINRFYKYLPLALFIKPVGQRWIEFFHGGPVVNGFAEDFLKGNEAVRLFNFDHNGIQWDDCLIQNNVAIQHTRDNRQAIIDANYFNMVGAMFRGHTHSNGRLKKDLMIRL